MLHLMDQGAILLTWVIRNTCKGRYILSGTAVHNSEHLSLPKGFLSLEQVSRMGSPKSPGSSSPFPLILSLLSWFFLHQNKDKIKIYLLYLPPLKAIYLSKARETCLWWAAGTGYQGGEDQCTTLLGNTVYKHYTLVQWRFNKLCWLN